MPSNKHQLAFDALKTATLADEFLTVRQLAGRLTWDLEETTVAVEALLTDGTIGVIEPGGRNPTVTERRYIVRLGRPSGSLPPT